MRKTVALVIGWFLAGVGAVTLASVAVGAVGDQVAPSDRPPALSAADVQAQLGEAASTTTTAPGKVPPPTTSTVDDHGGDSPGSDDRGGATSTTDDRGGSFGSPTTTTRPPSTGGPTTPAATTKTFNVIGGTVTLRFSAAGVTVVTAKPNAGYSVGSEPEHGNGIRVEFESDSHRSRVSGWWDGGARSETREDTNGGGGGDDGSGGGGSGGPG